MKKLTCLRFPSKDPYFDAPDPSGGIRGAPRAPKCSPWGAQGGLESGKKSMKNEVWLLQGSLGGAWEPPGLKIEHFVLFFKYFW